MSRHHIPRRIDSYATSSAVLWGQEGHLSETVTVLLPPAPQLQHLHPLLLLLLPKAASLYSFSALQVFPGQQDPPPILTRSQTQYLPRRAYGTSSEAASAPCRSHAVSALAIPWSAYFQSESPRCACRPPDSPCEARSDGTGPRRT